MITQTLTTSFKTELLQGIHDFSADTFKIALYTSDASLGADTTAYTPTGEVPGSTPTLVTSGTYVLDLYGGTSGGYEYWLYSATDPTVAGVAIGQSVVGTYIQAGTQVVSFLNATGEPGYDYAIELSLPTITPSNTEVTETVSFYTLSTTANGYYTGGSTLIAVGPSSDGTTAYVTFNDTSWSNASFITAGALIYNSSKDNKSVATLNFGSNKTANGVFTVQFPSATSSTAIIRIA